MVIRVCTECGAEFDTDGGLLCPACDDKEKEGYEESVSDSYVRNVFGY